MQAGPIARDIADEFGVDRKRTAGLLDIFSSAFQGLMPYAGQLLMAAGMAQIPQEQLFHTAGIQC